MDVYGFAKLYKISVFMCVMLDVIVCLFIVVVTVDPRYFLLRRFHQR